MELLGLSPAAWVIAVSIVVFGSTLQSSTGFGLGLVSSPVLVLLDPTTVPAVILGYSLPLSLLMIAREWGETDLWSLRWAVIGRFPGSVVGSWIVLVLGTRELSLAFAGSLLLAVVLSLAGLRVDRTSTNLFGAGFLAGLTGTATSVGGPVLALVYQDEPGPRLRTTMSVLLAIGTATSIALLVGVGEFGWRDLALAAVLTPATLVGLWLSRWTVAYLDRGYTRPAVLVFATAGAAVVIARAL